MLAGLTPRENKLLKEARMVAFMSDEEYETEQEKQDLEMQQ